MTIKVQTEAVLAHPSFKDAIEQYNQGDDKALKHLISEIMIHLWQKTTITASRVYGQSKWLDSGVIIKEIRQTPPPDNLDMRLPIPPRKEVIILKMETPPISQQG